MLDLRANQLEKQDEKETFFRGTDHSYPQRRRSTWPLL